MVTIYHCLHIAASPETVRAALVEKAGLAGWWTKAVEGDSAPGCNLTFRFSSGAFNTMKVQSVQPMRVEWECTAGHEEWTGTRVRFDVRPEGGGAKLCFSHSGWRGQTEYFGECSFHWAQYLVSLRRFCETGRGTPNEGSSKTS